MICDECFKKETAAQERDEQYAQWYNEQHRIRYEGTHIFDNGVNRISVVFHRKQLCSWYYYGEEHRHQVMLTAKGYVEGWLDAIGANEHNDWR
jgi:hypothetical protein